MKVLPLKLQTHPFTLRQAQAQGVSRYLLGKWILEGSVESLARGIYRATKPDLTEEDSFRSASLRVGQPSAICLLSALSHYGLTDLIPKKTWIMVPMAKRASFSDLKLLRARNPHWKTGIIEEEGYWITSIERTIVDTLHYRARIGTELGVQALRQALHLKTTTLGKVLDMAIQLGLDHRIRPYIEALS